MQLRTYFLKHLTEIAMQQEVINDININEKYYSKFQWYRRSLSTTAFNHRFQPRSPNVSRLHLFGTVDKERISVVFTICGEQFMVDTVCQPTS